ncbi:hypothetical protein K505DRAFT_194608, partial [Melanomma pulvis-pyrius CBS 109.77]
IERLKNIDVKEISKALVAWCKANPKTLTIIIVAIVVSILFGALAPMMLSGIGFSAAGPVAGTIAAGWQASIGSVAAGSFFAILQSAAMGGFGVAIVS